MPGISTPYLLHKLVFQLDRAADQLLRDSAGISYKRAIFLLVLEQAGTVTQHQLAVALGYSDPAVSTMLVELAKDGLVSATISASHARKRLVSITPKGAAAIAQGKALLNRQFEQLLQAAEVDAQQYRDLTERISTALEQQAKEEAA